MNITLTLQPAVYIMFATIIFLVTCGLCVLLFISIRKERLQRDDIDSERAEKGYVTKSQLVSAMDYFIRRYRFDNEMSLFVVELDSKSLRDSFGEKQYARFYKTIMRKVVDTLPKNALICETGTDQFSILLRGAIPPSRIEAFADNLINVIQNPVTIQTIETGRINIYASMGVVVYPNGGTNSKELLKNAEMALYMCKKDYTKNFVIFTNDVDKSEEENMAYYHQIKDAMRNKEFTLVYQPIIDTRNNTFFGFEALIRWVHPTLGVLSPNKFLNIMEHTNDIVWVGKWGIEAICAQYNEWRKNPAFNQDFMISFNLSPKQLLDPQITSEFQSILRKYKVSPSVICLEIVEFAMFEKFGIVGENIQKLHDFGFTIAIDDFGLDVNSLSRISSLPIDIIKFERDFVSKAENNYMMTKVVNMLVGFANDQKKIVIAEGVEDKESLKKIEDFGIHCIQGYFFSKPVSPLEIVQLAEDKSWINKDEVVEEVKPLEEEVKEEKVVEEVQVEETPVEQENTEE